ncbi:MAG: PIN domain-containing protein [Candidatus Eremiobacterota bacterium]
MIFEHWRQQGVRTRPGCSAEELDTFEGRLRVIPLSDEILQLSHPLRTRYGLLVNDSLFVASALIEGISVLASADRDLVGIDGVLVYCPGDLGASD